MPSEGAPADIDEEREAYPAVEERIGENPARWLDVDVLDDSLGASPLVSALARIRGIDSLTVLEGWRGVEHALGYVREECPRQQVLDALDEREHELQERGERPDRLEDQDPADRPDRQVTWYYRDRGDGGERVPIDAARSTSATGKLQARRSAATDGGDDA